MGRGSVAVPQPGVSVGRSLPGDLVGVRAYDDGRAWRRDSLSEDGIGWIGAHGGAGATTLTRLLGGTDIGCRWPDPALAEPARVMVVGRTNLDGLRAVSRALNALREGRHPAGMRLVGVVLIADAPGGLPSPLLGRIRLLRSIAPVYRLPWIPSYRVGEEPKRPPRQLSRLSTVVGPRVERRRAP
ncbi:hypothetical protein SAMN05443287_103630 [Micromonospora phaseoli]|uniref:Uncharacterized protein n=1 Tax=Micromonospora phaseoli TaxID=1144548 RepID=A0A1H6XGS3_9ACTN|nr:hypothetical protein [Micromonospora phaseoli]PZW02254.1 hypothetical protein CLV64_102628 [Micromonospora phaseoli]GIJ75743.1 hypothetical protein Xph01_01750 [Micromonospora phaseoli]SEJ28318.1 hypothetical protein SAMN05443287_103630 [Micromonospora phaseoli]